MPTPEFTTQQFAAARAQAWHQAGEPLLTLEAARTWLEETGILLFAPRPQLATSAPSLVEATLGTANNAPTLAQTHIARELAARLTSEAHAVPLNLLGVPGDVPDFLVTTQAFSYIFTLRGDKAWKQPPTTNVSPLALHVYETLTEKGSMTAAELANELGREVTETAISRALGELWSQLRVLPQLQLGEAPTLWELTTQRHTKALKAGANAGQPRALSALISFYLAQAIAATEEDTEIFLSPLTARSRVREVLHALSAARQLETVVLEGKTLLYVPGTLPAFPVIEEPAAVAAEGQETAEPSAPAEEGAKPERIRSFKSDTARKPYASRERKPFTPREGGERKPYTPRERKPFTPREGGERKPFTPREGGGFKSDRERRPFQRRESGDARPSFDRKPRFDKPWEENRKPREEGAAAEGSGERRPYQRREPSADRPSFDRKPRFNKPAFGDRKPPFRKPREEGAAPEGTSERRPYQRRESGAARPSFDRKPRFDGERKPYAAKDGAARRPYKPREEGGEDRPRFNRKPDGKFAPKRSFGDKPSFGDRPKRTYGDKPSFSDRPKRTYGDKPSFGDRPKRTYGDKPSSSDRPKRTYGDKPAFGDRPKRSYGDKPSFGDRPKRTYGDKPASGDRPRRSYGDKPAGKSFGGAKPFAKKFGSKPAGKFGGKPGGKPFGGRPAPRTPRPKNDK